MSLPIGNWSINSQGTEGVLAITAVDAQGNVTGTLQLDPSSTVNITGTWDDTTKKLTFSYNVGQFIFFRVTYTGYFFLAGQPLFGQVGPVNPPAWNMLAGTLRSGILLWFGTENGWMARLAV
jgi:hypothetical protein